MKTFAVLIFLIVISIDVCCKAKQDNNPLKSTSVSDQMKNNGTYDDSSIVLTYNLTVQESLTEVSNVSESFSENGTLTRELLQQYMIFNRDGITSFTSAIESCRVLLSLALYNLNKSTPTSNLTTPVTRQDFKIWLSAAAADLETCIDGFKYAPEQAKKMVAQNLENSTKHIINILSIISKIDEHEPSIIDDVIGSGRSLNWLPSWSSFEDWKINNLRPDVVVAADGTGNYKWINEALKVVPRNSTSRRFVIYVKKGIYMENVVVDWYQWNVIMFGDGMENTIVSGNLSNSTGSAIFRTATFAVYGDGFMAMNMGFKNTAGPTKGPAVALVSSSDRSVFYKCSIEGYQDTLFAHTNRQFYRECKIYGTIDFIFGYSSFVIQNSNILVKKPLHGQGNSITAQGRSDPKLVSGIVIQNCEVAAVEDLGGARTYLGRPWKYLSTTIFMESQLGGLIDPAGWSPWIDNVTPPDTIYYAEYNNRGPGAATSGRVRWKGVRVNIN